MSRQSGSRGRGHPGVKSPQTELGARPIRSPRTDASPRPVLPAIPSHPPVPQDMVGMYFLG